MAEVKLKKPERGTGIVQAGDSKTALLEEIKNRQNRPLREVKTNETLPQKTSQSLLAESLKNPNLRQGLRKVETVVKREKPINELQEALQKKFRNVRIQEEKTHPNEDNEWKFRFLFY